MKKIIKWSIRIVGGLILFCLLMSPFLFTTIDRTPYKEMPYYGEMMAQLDTFRLDTTSQSGPLKAGWASKNITPSYMPSLAGYGIREVASCLHDSVFVRAVVFENNKTKVVFLTADLLIFPPILEKRLRSAALELGFAPQNLYFSATHTHNAPGGWVAGPAGRFLAGEYKEEYVEELYKAMTDVIKAAASSTEEAETGFGLVEAGAFIRNRLNMPDSKTDPWVRILKVKKKTGASAAIVTYAAHANCLRMAYTCISADYPGRMIQSIQKSGKVDFVLYSAGMVGSHTPKTLFNNSGEMENEPFIEAYGDSLADRIVKVLDGIKLTNATLIATAMLDLPLREPHLKISKDLRVRPWVFDQLFGPYDPKINIVKLGNTVFIGTPCDFSGELMVDFEQVCKERNINLVITSFNGGYIGYINVDRHYDLNKAEVRDMNWFGPYNQAYFTEFILKILKKV